MKSVFMALVMASLATAQATPDVKAFLSHGADLVAAGRLSEAQELYERAVQSFPANPQLRFELGLTYFRQKNWPKAIDNFNQSIRTAPRQVKPWFYLAQTYWMESDLEAARDAIAQAASIAPDDAQVCQKYGEILSSSIDSRQPGLDWLEKARRLNPGLMRIDFDVGKTQFQLTDIASAKSSLEAALKKDPGDGEAAYYLAESWASLSEWDHARDGYRYALSHGYENANCFYGLGRALVELGDSTESVEPLRQALALQPSLAKVHFQLGKAYRHLGQMKDAQHEAKLFALMSDRVDTSDDLNNPEQAKARKAVRPFLELNQEQEALDLLARLPHEEFLGKEVPQYLLGTVYFTMGRKEDAKRLLIAAQRDDPASSLVPAYLGMVELSMAENGAAEVSFQSALTLNSREPLALIGLGDIRYRQQRWSEAAELLEKSRTADPGSLYMLCDAYFRTGRTEDAFMLAEVTRALAVDQKPLLADLDKLIKLHQQHP